MLNLVFVVVPLCLQLLVGAGFLLADPAAGGFVGLGVMLLGLVAIPVTTVINLARLRRGLAPVDLVLNTLFTTLVYPLLCLALYALAS
jgi:hypothetical protein